MLIEVRKADVNHGCCVEFWRDGEMENVIAGTVEIWEICE